MLNFSDFAEAIRQFIYPKYVICLKVDVGAGINQISGKICLPDFGSLDGIYLILLSLRLF